MANGKAKKLYYLSPLDPGVGKSQSIIHFVRRLIKSEAHRGVSVLICLGRLKEIERMVAEIGLSNDDYSVLVNESDANKELNRAGNADKRQARVLFTTQQMVESRTRRYASFKEAEDFYFRGQPRHVRIWDEAILRAREVKISAALIGGLLPEADTNPRLYNTLTKLQADIEAAGHETELWIPDLPAETGLDTNDIIALYGDEKEAIAEAAIDLWELSNTPVIVEEIGVGTFAIHYKKHLPDDLKPMVICDASGRVRQTYKYWEEIADRELVKLRDGGKNYRDLTVKIWRRGGGKSSWGEDADVLLEGITKTIDQIPPDEEVLIVHHMKNKRKRIPDIEEAIRRKVKEPRRLRFTHWGGEDFKASNDYRDIRHVILAGTMFYRPATYIARTRMSSGAPSEEKLNRANLAKIKLGEHADMILQALCRGAVRKSVDGTCGKCDAYIIADPQTGIPDMLEHESDIDIFPGSKHADWSPVEKEKLGGRVGQAYDYIVQWFKDHPGYGERLSRSKVAEAIGMVLDDFTKDVVGHRDFEGYLAEAGIRLIRMRGRGGSYFERR
ncbi:hypothetical protein ORS3428_13785 [Mesorhizobium sp. ORS 3428]|nr:hypothetical protein ORS3428_13785 [Mesorhizobium sp. ORS 3428]